MRFSIRTFFLIFFSACLAVLLAYGGNVYIERVNDRREQRALTDAKQLGLATLEYAQDHKDHYPDAGKWEQELTPYLGADAAQIIHPPAPFQGTPRRFSMNPSICGKTLAQITEPTNIWMFYESVAPKHSATDDLEYWPDADRNGGHLFAVVYGDGHCYSRPQAWKEGIRQHLPGL